MPTKDGKMTAREFRDRKRPRKATYYKLSEKDEPIIIEGLKKFVPAYVLATKIGCGYRQMSQYIKSHPHLLEVQRDAEQNMVSFAKGKLMQNVGAGHAASIFFLLERLDPEHFGRQDHLDDTANLPNITIGLFPADQLVNPTDPGTVSKDAAELLKYAEREAERVQDEEDARLDAEAEAAEAGAADAGE